MTNEENRDEYVSCTGHYKDQCGKPATQERQTFAGDQWLPVCDQHAEYHWNRGLRVRPIVTVNGIRRANDQAQFSADECPGTDSKPVVAGSLEDYQQQTGDYGLVQAPEGFDWNEAQEHLERSRCR